MAITYIVVTEKNSWGKAEDDLAKAMSNAGLNEATRTEFFTQYLEEDFNLGQAAKGWKEYGEAEQHMIDDDPVRCVLYQCNDEDWEDYSVSHMDGGVTFIPKEGRYSSQEEVDTAFSGCYINAKWTNGLLEPR